MTTSRANPADAPGFRGVEPLALAAGPDSWSDWLTGRCDSQLALAREIVAVLKATPPDEPLEVLRRWNDVGIALSNAMSAASTVANVHPRQEIRQQAEQAELEGQKLATDLSLDRDLYDLLSVTGEATLDEEARRMRERSLRDFRRSGVDREESTRDRLRELAERETQLSQDFGRAIREDVRSISVDPTSLAGLPADYVEDHPAGPDGKVVITTDYPDALPFFTFAHDGAARRELRLAFLNRAWPAGDGLVRELIAVRQEQAHLLGYAGWPDYDAEVKMIGRGDAVATFIDQIADAALEPGLRDVAVLLGRRRLDEPEAQSLDSTNHAYYAEIVRREQYDVDAQLVRTYFDFGTVRDGLLAVTGRLFGLDYAAVTGATAWHEDVTSYDVLFGGERMGRIHLDLHPREGKYKHAAQFDLVGGVSGRQLPEGTLVCNFPRGLMEHSDVVTLFHEFGHLVHHVVGGDQRWVRFSGVATEWDFVEAPSQMLEEWAWDPQVLGSFARNAAGEPIPADLVAKMRAADDFGKGYHARTQMFYAAVSYWLHQEPEQDLTAQVRDLQERYDLLAAVDGTHMHASFGHLNGYSSGYYTYMWSLVIAKDLFSAFDSENLFEPTTAGRYRDLVLRQGGRRDAADLVSDFLGRPYDFAAFAAWLASPAHRPE